MIYLDHNASTPLDPEVRDTMSAAGELYGNPSSVHSAGRRARRAIEEAREEVARLVGATAEEVFFTSGGTEANALAVFGTIARARGRIVTSAVEHPSVREPIARLAQAGFETVSVAPEASGELDPGKVGQAALPGTLLVSIMAANNEYGGLYPISRIAADVRERGIP
ncbi:MAG TPA: aminotransferase class V-fold PLP-dependent enzyme, partial [Thermoanaerobaculia bacterium]